MNEEIRSCLATLNATWQRYAIALEQQLDTIPMSALNRDYLAAWEGLDACGIAEWMLVYDNETLTFSLPDDLFTERWHGNRMADPGATQLI
ncbi:MAG TPA: hypothetical protein VF458_17730 [Ktedonobacteraceae bacterium]